MDEELEAEIERLEAERAPLEAARVQRLADALASPRAELEALERHAAELGRQAASVAHATTVLEARLAEVGPVPWLGLVVFFVAAAAAGGPAAGGVAAVGSLAGWGVGRFLRRGEP